jgi:hypothetical protein
VVVEIGSIEGKAYISLTQWEADDYQVRAAIAVREGDFAGAMERVWFFRKDFVAFVQALREFSVAHKGTARLESMSPGEVVVSISRLDLAGHILVETQVSRWQYVGDRPFRNLVAVAFELDPSQLPDVVQNLAAVIAKAQPS